MVFDKKPFSYNGTTSKTRGLNWEGIDRSKYAILADFLDKATHPDFNQRFESAMDAIAALKPESLKETSAETEELPEPVVQTVSREVLTQQLHTRNEVGWLKLLLEAYPGSQRGNKETRGLDTDFAKRIYVSTELEEVLLEDIEKRRASLVILRGNAGDGKTALLQSLADRLGFEKQPSSERIIEKKMDDGFVVRMNLDGSASWKGSSADELLDEFLKPFQEGSPDEKIICLLAINDGRLLEWAEGKDTLLTDELVGFLGGESPDGTSHIRFINLNHRSLVGGINEEKNEIETDFLEGLLEKLYGEEKASETWAPCKTCSAQTHCEVFRAMQIFGPDNIPSAEPKETRERARRQLFKALQSIHLRGETHVTIRELRAALIYILFGTHYCDEYHEFGDENKLQPYWDRAFSPDSPARQGEVLEELIFIDPALESHPKIDRYLTGTPTLEGAGTANSYEKLSRESARRRAFFEWTERRVEEIGDEKHALDLAKGRHLNHFRNLPVMSQEELEKLCMKLCRGISRLEDLPPRALDKGGVVPLSIPPRTPTETEFWVEKSLTAFRLEPDMPSKTKGLDRLHRQAFLVYSYKDEKRGEERLRLGSELFHLLLELSEGYQLGDVSTDDTFAHLSIFVQRLIREDERKLFAWNPMCEEEIYEISAIIRDMPEGVRQKIRIQTPTQEDSG